MPADMTGLPTGASSGPPDDRQSADSSGATGGVSTGASTGATGDASTGVTSGATVATDAAAAPAQVGPLRVGQAFGSVYRILKLLGAGGMGAVYQAWDAELSVAVALKVIRQSSRSPEVERQFKNEL